MGNRHTDRRLLQAESPLLSAVNPRFSARRQDQPAESYHRATATAGICSAVTLCRTNSPQTVLLAMVDPFHPRQHRRPIPKFPSIGQCCRTSEQYAVRRLGCGARCRFLARRVPTRGKIWTSRTGTERSQAGNRLASGVRPVRCSTDHDPTIPAAHTACPLSGSVVLSSQVSPAGSPLPSWTPAPAQQPNLAWCDGRW